MANAILKSVLCLNLLLCFCASNLKSEAVYSQPLEAKELPVGNYLEWQTITEIDVANFIIEKSTDGLNWLELGSVSGAGFSMVDNRYHFLDLGANDPKNFYRLKELAEDGTTSYSFPTELHKKLSNLIQIANMTSTDVSANFKLTVDVLKEAKLACSITDFTGKQVQSFDFQAVNGLNNIEVNLENSKPGFYKLNVKLGSEVESILLRRVDDGAASKVPVASTRKAGGSRQ